MRPSISVRVWSICGFVGLWVHREGISQIPEKWSPEDNKTSIGSIESHSFIHSFFHSFINSFIILFIHSFIHSFRHPFGRIVVCAESILLSVLLREEFVRVLFSPFFLSLPPDCSFAFRCWNSSQSTANSQQPTANSQQPTAIDGHPRQNSHYM